MTPGNIVLSSVSLADLQSEKSRIANKGRTSRLKIEKGHAALLRWLPYPIDPTGRWYAHLAQHWIGAKGRPIDCKQMTDPNFGGDPSYQCPICAILKIKHDEAQGKEDKDYWFKMTAREVYRTFVIVNELEDDRGRKTQTPDEALFEPVEFNIPPSAFSELNDIVRHSMAGDNAPPLGILDLERGRDVWVSRRTDNKLALKEQHDATALFPLDDQFDARCKRVWNRMKPVTVTFLTDEQTYAKALMIEEGKAEQVASEMAAEGQAARNARFSQPAAPASSGRFSGTVESDGVSRPVRTPAPAGDPEPAPTVRPSRVPTAPTAAPAPSSPRVTVTSAPAPSRVPAPAAPAAVQAARRSSVPTPPPARRPAGTSARSRARTRWPARTRPARTAGPPPRRPPGPPAAGGPPSARGRPTAPSR